MSTATQSIPVAEPHLTTHEHAWVTASRHRTSEGTIIYVSCVSCGAYRVERTQREQMVPLVVSAVVAPAAS